MQKDSEIDKEQLITIGIPCFNAENTIERAIQSALNQDWLNIEVIIVDDFSTDESCKIINKIISHDARARLIIHDNNKGPGAVRGRILSEANGEFVAFFDDDDESLPERISEQIKLLISYEERTGNNLIACYASGIRLYPNGYTKLLPAIGSRCIDIPYGPSVADYLLYYHRRRGWFYGSGTPTCALLARHSTFSTAGGFDPKLRRVEDVDFAIRLALMNGHFIGTKKRLFIQYTTNTSDKTPEVNLEAEQNLVRKYRDYLIKRKRFNYAYNWPRLRFYHFKKQYIKMFIVFINLFIRYPLSSTRHILTTGSNRLLHEFKINR